MEQPVSAADPAGLRHVAARSPLPLAADGPCVTLSDVPKVAEWADVANVKLMKCGAGRRAGRSTPPARTVWG